MICVLKSRHRDLAMASGGMSESDFTQFLRTAFDRLCAVSADGAIHFICVDWRHMREMLDAAIPFAPGPLGGEGKNTGKLGVTDESRARTSPARMFRAFLPSAHHYLLCGNALDMESYQRLLGSAKAQLVFTDPPGNGPL